MLKTICFIALSLSPEHNYDNGGMVSVNPALVGYMTTLEDEKTFVAFVDRYRDVVVLETQEEILEKINNCVE